jgi:hypothetical protein
MCSKGVTGDSRSVTGVLQVCYRYVTHRQDSGHLCRVMSQGCSWGVTGVLQVCACATTLVPLPIGSLLGLPKIPVSSNRVTTLMLQICWKGVIGVLPKIPE